MDIENIYIKPTVNSNPNTSITSAYFLQNTPWTVFGMIGLTSIILAYVTLTDIEEKKSEESTPGLEPSTPSQINTTTGGKKPRKTRKNNGIKHITHHLSRKHTDRK
jgi:hypothetical protein